MLKPFENTSWELLVARNKELCEKSGYQHGFTSDGHKSAKQFYEGIKNSDLSIPEAVDYLRALHKMAPFLFLNGNTFCQTGLELLQKHEIASKYIQSSVNHHIAGTSVLSMEDLNKIIIPTKEEPVEKWDDTSHKIILAMVNISQIS